VGETGRWELGGRRARFDTRPAIDRGGADGHLQHFCNSGCKYHAAPVSLMDIDKICSQSSMVRPKRRGLNMDKARSLLLAATAAFVAACGAQAADMPVKAQPVQYVKICSLYGDGFYYIPGTDTCLKLGGYLRV
jgi:Porin subfamily